MIFASHASENATVVSLLAGALRRDIACGDLPLDRKLKIESLRTRYGGSTHSLREALNLLSAEDLVESTAQRGFRVASATEQDLIDVTRLWIEIECLGLRWSMASRSVEWAGFFIAAHHALRKAQAAVIDNPGDSALLWDNSARDFPVVLLLACDSTRHISMQQTLCDQSRRFRLVVCGSKCATLNRCRITSSNCWMLCCYTINKQRSSHRAQM